LQATKQSARPRPFPSWVTSARTLPGNCSNGGTCPLSCCTRLSRCCWRFCRCGFPTLRCLCQANGRSPPWEIVTQFCSTASAYCKEAFPIPP
jgi:hypothetical protein